MITNVEQRKHRLELNREYAVRLLNHYLSLPHENPIKWESDNSSEVRSVVDSIETMIEDKVAIAISNFENELKLKGKI